MLDALASNIKRMVSLIGTKGLMEAILDCARCQQSPGARGCPSDLQIAIRKCHCAVNQAQFSEPRGQFPHGLRPSPPMEKRGASCLARAGWLQPPSGRPPALVGDLPDH